jgi:hypothetical protein
MKRDWSLKPNLLDCILEQRIAPAIANLATIVLTTSGFTLVTPFPGASNSASSTSVATSANSVSGAAVPTSFYVTGNRGISSFAPGNFTGNPNVAIALSSGSVGGTGLSIQVGSGADEAGGTPTSSRTTPGYDGATAPIMAYIGSTSTGSGTPVLPAGQTYAPPTPPVPALPPLGMVIPGSPMGISPTGSQSTPFNPQSGAPMFTPGNASGMTSPLPGGLGVSGGLLQPGSSPNN